jgi:hypothetical protein
VLEVEPDGVLRPLNGLHALIDHQPAAALRSCVRPLGEVTRGGEARPPTTSIRGAFLFGVETNDMLSAADAA